MPPAPFPPLVLEPFRLAALASYGILDTPPEPEYDGIVQLACRLCDTPVALVSLVDRDRQWFKARIGFPECETDLNSSVCAHALAEPDQLLIIPDLKDDPRTSANPLVTGEPFIRFYAGAPLVDANGHVLGSLCAIDTVARPGGLTAAQADDLRVLAQQVASQLALRRAIRERDDLRLTEAQGFQERNALRDTQIAIERAGDDLESTLRTVVNGAMYALRAAEGGVIELLDGDQLEYTAVEGTLARHRGLRVGLADTIGGHCATTRQPQVMRDALTDPRMKRELATLLGVRSAVAAPILRGDELLGVLKLQSSKPDAFLERDRDLLQLFAGEATASLTQARTRAEVRAKDVYWRGLFDRLSEGFLIGEATRDAKGRILDWRYVEANPAFERLMRVSLAEVAGRTIREVAPEIENEWITDFASVVDTGKASSFTRRVGILRRWFEGRAFALDGDRFGVILLDITSRVEADERRTALLSIGDRLRELTSIPEMTAMASEIVGRTLGGTRAGFGMIDGEVEHIDIEADWTAPGTASIAGRHRFDDYGDIRAHLARGEALIINDVTTDPRTSSDPGPMQAIGITALVNMPVRERGRTIAVFILHDIKPRRWTLEELAFLRNVADRLEAGVARVRAEQLQNVLNTELAHRLKNTLAIVQSIAGQTLRGVTEREAVEAFNRRVLALSRAHDVLLQKSWTAARLRSVMESVLSLQADIDRFALDGPDMDISPQAALSLSMLLHELATNAVKYGALSADAGQVRIAWRMDGGGAPTVVLDWAESGGPAVTAPAGRTGFGSKLIRMGLLGTRAAELRYEPLGLRAEFRAPLAEFQVQAH